MRTRESMISSRARRYPELHLAIRKESAAASASGRAESGSPETLAFAARASESNALANLPAAFAGAESTERRRSPSQASWWYVRKTSAVAVRASHTLVSRRQICLPGESDETYSNANHSRTTRSRYSSAKDTGQGAGEVGWPVARALRIGAASPGPLGSIAEGLSRAFIFSCSSLSRRCASVPQLPPGSTRRYCSQSRMASL